MAVSLSGIDATVRLVLLAVLATAAVVVMVMAAGGLWVSRLGLRPIAEVTRVADAIVAGDRSRRVAAATSRTEAAVWPGPSISCWTSSKPSRPGCASSSPTHRTSCGLR